MCVCVGGGEQLVRYLDTVPGFYNVTREPSLSFQANDLKFGMVTRIDAFYHRAKYHKDRFTTA